MCLIRVVHGWLVADIIHQNIQNIEQLASEFFIQYMHYLTWTFWYIVLYNVLWKCN